MNIRVKAPLDRQHGSGLLALLGKLSHSAVRYSKCGIITLAAGRPKNHAHKNLLRVSVHRGQEDLMLSGQVHRPRVQDGKTPSTTIFWT